MTARSWHMSQDSTTLFEIYFRILTLEKSTFRSLRQVRVPLHKFPSRTHSPHYRQCHCFSEFGLEFFRSILTVFYTKMNFWNIFESCAQTPSPSPSSSSARMSSGFRKTHNFSWTPCLNIIICCCLNSLFHLLFKVCLDFKVIVTGIWRDTA